MLWFPDNQILCACTEENLQTAQCICSAEDRCI